MKQDILIFFMIPPMAIISTVFTQALLSLLNILDISTSVDDLQLITFLLLCYYLVVIKIIIDSMQILEGKAVALVGGHKMKSQSYGTKTEEALQKLKQSNQFIKWDESKNEDKGSDSKRDQQQISVQSRRRSGKIQQFFIEEEDSEQDHEITCHKMATSKKMF